MKMYFEIKRIQREQSNVWAITPLSGVMEGCPVAYADGVCLRDVMFDNKALSGTVFATWGLAIDEIAHSDIHTLRALRIGKAFDCRPHEALHPDIDGYVDRANRVVRSALAATVIGDEVYIKRYK